MKAIPVTVKEAHEQIEKFRDTLLQDIANAINVAIPPKPPRRVTRSSTLSNEPATKADIDRMLDAIRNELCLSIKELMDLRNAKDVINSTNATKTVPI